MKMTLDGFADLMSLKRVKRKNTMKVTLDGFADLMSLKRVLK